MIMKSHISQKLNKFELFACLPESKISYLMDNIQLIKIPQDDYLIRNPSKVYFLLQGKLKLCEWESTEQIIKYVLRTGDLFWEDHQSDEIEQFAEGTAVPSEVVTIPSVIVNELKSVSADFLQNYCSLLAQKCFLLERQLRTLAQKDIRQRLMLFLAQLKENDGVLVDDKVVVDNYLSQHEIASMIGTTRVSVTKFLSELRSNGSLVYDRRQFHLIDHEPVQY